MFWQKRTLLVTHNGSFHSDDIFACATLMIHFNQHCKVVRTRDEKIIDSGDIVFDVGGIYDAEKNRFDHHQAGGAGIRENGIPYAAFGLVWKKYGPLVCESEEIAAIVDRKLVQAIDADDNGVNTYQTLIEDVTPYTIQSFVKTFLPPFHNDVERLKKELDQRFLLLVGIAQGIIRREIDRIKQKEATKKTVADLYAKSADKRIIIVGPEMAAERGIADILIDYPEPLYLVFPRVEHNSWGVVAIKKEKGQYGNRKDMPAAWAGQRDSDFAKISGVPDAIFCHNKLFLAGAESKEGAVKLAQIAAGVLS